MPHPDKQAEMIGRNLPRVEPESSDDLPIWRSALKPLASALGTFAGLPGVKHVFEASEAVSARSYGTLSGYAMAHKAAIKEQGWGGWAAEQLNPFDDADMVQAKFDQIVGLDGYESLSQQLDATADWQRNRNSAFFGEKFIGEMLFDPLNLVPMGAVAKVIGTAGKIARITAVQQRRIQRSKIGNIADPNVIDESGAWAATAEKLGFDENRIGRAATRTVKLLKNTPVGFLQHPMQLINPAGLVRYSSNKIPDKMKKRTFLYGRQLEEANSVIAGDLAYLQLLEMSKPFNIVTKKLDGVEQKIITNVQLKPGAVGKTDDILMGDVIEFPDNYVLSTGQRELLDESYRVIEGTKARLLEAGIKLEDTVLKPDQHYFPRFVEMYDGFKVDNASRSGRAIGAEPSMMKKRFYDELGDGALNGVSYFSATTNMPLSEVVQSYMNMSLKQVIDQAFMDDLLRITKRDVLAMRKIKAIGPGSLRGAIRNSQEQLAIVRNARKTASEWNRGGMQPTTALYEQLDSLDQGMYLSKELRRIVNPYTVNALGDRVWRADPMRLAKDPMTRGEQLANVQFQQAINSDLSQFRKTLSNFSSEANVALKEQRNYLNSLREKVRIGKLKVPGEMRGKGVRFPAAMFPEPEFNTHLFSKEAMDEIMPILTPSDELIRQSTKLQRIPGGATAVIGTLRGAAEFGRTARAFQLTYDLGTQFLQGAMVMTRAPGAWLRATQKSFNSWNNPQKIKEYLLQPEIEELRQLFQGKLHIGSTEFTEAFHRGGMANRVLGVVPLAGRTTEKFRTGFDAFGDVARFEMARAFMPAIKRGLAGGNGPTVDQVANHINKITGISSSRKLGIGATQKELEAAMISLAPNYLRSTVALFADAAQILFTTNIKRAGRFGLTLETRFESQQAVYALTRFFGGTVLAYVGICKALGQEPKLNPRSAKEDGDGGRFMTVIIDGQVVGMGSKPYSIARTATAAAMALHNDRPGEAYGYIRRFFRGQAAPLTSTMWDNITGENFNNEAVQTTGERLENVSSRLLPFWAEAAIFDDPKPSVFGTTTDFVGLRAWPLNYYDIASKIGEELISKISPQAWKSILTDKQQRKMAAEYMDVPTWDMLSGGQRNRIERGEIPGLDPVKLKELERIREVKAENDRRTGPPRSRAYKQELHDVRTLLERESEKYQVMYEQGRIDPREMRDRIRTLNVQYGSKIEEMHKDGGPHEEYLQQKQRDMEEDQRRGKEIPLEDAARQEYIDYIISDNELSDYLGGGGYDWQERDRRINELRGKYGHEIIRNVEREFIMNKKVGVLYKQLQLDKEELAPYWDIQNRYIEQNNVIRALLQAQKKARSDGNLERVEEINSLPRYKGYRKTITRARRELLIDNPQLNAILVFWGYPATLHTEAARVMFKELVKKAKAGILRQ